MNLQVYFSFSCRVYVLGETGPWCSAVNKCRTGANQGHIGRHRRTYPEEDSFDFSAVFAHLLVYDRVEDVFGGDAGVRYTLIVTHHPYEHIRNAVLGLDEQSPHSQEANIFTA